MWAPSLPGTYGACSSDDTARWGEMRVEIHWGGPHTGKSFNAEQRRCARIAVVEGMEWRKFTPQAWIDCFTVDESIRQRYAKIIVIYNENPALWWPNESSESKWNFFGHVTYIRYYGPHSIKFD